MKAPLLAGVAVCLLVATTTAQAPSAPDWLGNLQFASQRLGTGKVTLIPYAGGPPVRYRNIQAAVDAAVEGDTVLLSRGVFRGDGNYDVTVAGKNVTIRGEGPEETLIDCESKGRAFFFDGPLVTSATRLTGVTVLHGDRAKISQIGTGGAVHCSAVSRPTISNCLFAYCRASSAGAIQHDFASGAPFGLIQDCLFLGNSAIQGGAFSGAEVVIERCVFIGNRSMTHGGALDLQAGGGRVRDCLIRANEARPDFGSNKLGGGIYQRSPGWIVDNCTIVDNFVFGGGGGIAFGADLIATVSNTILWGNTATIAGQQAFAAGFFGGGQVTLLHCAIEGGDAGVDQGLTNPPLLISVLEADPSFLDPERGDFGLRLDSPCIDAGDPAFVPAVNEGDLDLQPRVNDIVDIGADEVWPGLALSLVEPGRVGEENAIVASGAAAGACISFFYGAEAGQQRLPFGACPELALDIADAYLAGSALAGLAGQASYAQLVPPELSGETLFFQAVALEPAPRRDPCSVSNLVTFTYP